MLTMPTERKSSGNEIYQIKVTLLRTLRNPQHKLHEELLEWVGEDYDPEKFSIEAINRILHGRKKRAARSLG